MDRTPNSGDTIRVETSREYMGSFYAQFVSTSWLNLIMHSELTSVSRDVNPTNPPPPRSRVLQRAIDLARQMLKDKDCNNAVSSSIQDARGAAATLDNNSGTVDEQPEDEGKDWFGEGSSLAYTWPPPSLTISFYKGFYGDANSYVDDENGKPTLTTMDLIPGDVDADLRRAWVVLHELSHATGRYIGHRGPTASSSATVNRRIYDACVKKEMERRHSGKK